MGVESRPRPLSSRLKIWCSSSTAAAAVVIDASWSLEGWAAMLRRLSQGVSFRRSSSAAEKEEAKASNPGGGAAPSEAPAPAPAPAAQRVWRAAKDPKTGRTYYYDVLTRETQ